MTRPAENTAVPPGCLRVIILNERGQYVTGDVERVRMYTKEGREVYVSVLINELLEEEA